jgi:uncharacterized Zn finger protein
MREYILDDNYDRCPNCGELKGIDSCEGIEYEETSEIWIFRCEKCGLVWYEEITEDLEVHIYKESSVK